MVLHWPLSASMLSNLVPSPQVTVPPQILPAPRLTPSNFMATDSSALTSALRNLADTSLVTGAGARWWRRRWRRRVQHGLDDGGGQGRGRVRVGALPSVAAGLSVAKACRLRPSSARAASKAWNGSWCVLVKVVSEGLALDESGQRRAPGSIPARKNQGPRRPRPGRDRERREGPARPPAVQRPPCRPKPPTPRRRPPVARPPGFGHGAAARAMP